MARITHTWEVVLAFFLGGAVSSIAQDPSDTIFFYAQSHGYTSAADQAITWYWVPFLVYLSLFLLGYAMARTGRLRPAVLIYFYMAMVLFSTYFSLTLPQSSTLIYVGAVLLGTVISIGILLGLRRRVMRGE